MKLKSSLYGTLLRRDSDKHNLQNDKAVEFVSALFRGLLHREPDPKQLKHYVSELLSGRSPAAIVDEFVDCKEYRLQNAIKMFVPPGHFYSPIVDPAVATRHFDSLEAAGTPDSIPGIELDRSKMIEVWQDLLPFLQSIPFPDDKTPDFRYAFNNPAYSWGDGSILHAMLRLHRPKRLVEVGSGWSSACSLDTVERYLGNECELTFIEPFPQLLRRLIGEVKGKIRIIDKGVQQVPLLTFQALEKGDFLFIDSTHVFSTGSDVCFEIFEILTRLAPGVIVHIHDMFWPFEYPRAWAVDENRSWNEIYAIRAFLTNNKSWRIVFFNDYFGRFEGPLIETGYPQFLRNPGGALWLERV